MVPKLHAKGSSFRGAAAYLLHDKGRATTADRLEWTQVRNLATDNPDTAWRVMAATAMEQGKLKAAAGIKNTGRKSNDHVLHFTLSWHPDESAGVNRDEMMRAALGAIRALKADEYQALIVAHNDEPQAHIHILINRVNPADGRILSSSKEKLALSKWAERYEKERGRVYCEERVLNNAARERGEFTRGEKDQARHLFKQEAANNNQKPPQSVQAEQKRKDAKVSSKAREIRKRHAEAVQAVDRKHRQRLADIRAKARRDVVLARQAVREKFRPEWKANFHVDQIEKATFGEKEQSFLGRMQNAVKAIDFGSIMRGQDRKQAISEAFKALADAGSRLELLRRSQEKRAREIVSRQKQDERAAALQIRGDRSAAQAQAREAYIKERQSLDMARHMDAAALRAAWKTRREQRADAWHKENEQPGRAMPAASAPRPPATKEPHATKAADMIPQDHRAAERARMIDQIKQRMREQERSNDNERER